jgi:hypothetical protein
MTLDEARRIVGAYQTRKAKAEPVEYMRYLEAREVVAKAGGLQMTAAMRGFLAAARRPQIPVEPT